MSINSLSAANPQQFGAQPSALGAVATGLSTVGSLAMLTGSLLQNVLGSASQLSGGMLPGAMGPGGPGAMGPGGAAGGLLQGMAGLLQAFTPLMQMLGNQQGANRPAAQIASQLMGSIGQLASSMAPLMGPAAPLMMAAGQVLGAGAGMANAFAGGAPGMPGMMPGAMPGMMPGAMPGMGYGQPALGMPVNNMYGTQMPGMYSVNTPATFGGGLSPQAAMSWVSAYGGPNLSAADTKTGMNLYSIFNSGRQMY